jgi:dihydroneopterin aldolase
MRQSNNKHYDTHGGFSANSGQCLIAYKSPPVSLKEDETMNQTERKVGDVIYIDVDKAAQIYAIGSDGNDVRYYYTYEGVRNFIYEKQCFLLEELHSNLMEQAQKDLLIELVKKERMRLTVALTAWNITEDEMRELNQERDLCTSTLKSLTGGE